MLKRLQDEGLDNESADDVATQPPEYSAELDTFVGEGHAEDDYAESTTWLDNDSQAFLVSLLFHVVLILALAVVPFVANSETAAILFTASPTIEDEEFTLVEDVAVSEEPSREVGANSDATDSSMALSMAPVLAELSELPSPSFEPPQLNATFDMNNRIDQAVGLVRSDMVVKGMTGVGTTGTDGAVDRITYEVLRSMEERPTLVVWFFDQSGSLTKRRQEIRDRFDRIYEELGIVAGEEAESKEDPRLLTSVFAFGEQVNLLTPKPTAELEEIRQAIDAIELDQSGVERVFSALYKGVEKFKSFRRATLAREAKNVLFIAVTDERGDDANGLDVTIQECKKYAIPVYVIGVPAPFGRDVTYVKYVDPDPKFDQTPSWAEVDQGPESILPERVRLGYRDDYYAEPVVDSGFGPFALSRIAYETGGIYFTVHPNRRLGGRVRRGEIDPFASNLAYFFDPEVMVKYRPDEVSANEYMKRVSESPLRQVLGRAAGLPRRYAGQSSNAFRETQRGRFGNGAYPSPAASGKTRTTTCAASGRSQHG
ncbi:MAG: VWA domain-containing protein [Pirellulaceae bacterium]